MRHRRLITTCVATLGAVAMGAAPALAHVCTNSAKPAGAGVHATATYDVIADEFTVTSGEELPNGRFRGGFLEITVMVGGQEVGSVDVFTQTTLPETARNAGPGDDMCDGVGIDDAEACLGG